MGNLPLRKTGSEHRENKCFAAIIPVAGGACVRPNPAQASASPASRAALEQVKNCVLPLFAGGRAQRTGRFCEPVYRCKLLVNSNLVDQQPKLNAKVRQSVEGCKTNVARELLQTSDEVGNDVPPAELQSSFRRRPTHSGRMSFAAVFARLLKQE